MIKQWTLYDIMPAPIAELVLEDDKKAALHTAEVMMFNEGQRKAYLHIEGWTHEAEIHIVKRMIGENHLLAFKVAYFEKANHYFVEPLGIERISE